MFIKYPKTFHIYQYWHEGEPLEALVKHSNTNGSLVLVVEEKMDGTQVGISFAQDSSINIQSRGNYVSSEPEFSMLKQWVGQHYAALFEVLGNRYILFGEWLYAKHTMFYDLLPDYFLEFDLYDRELGMFLSTPERQRLLNSLEFLSSVRIIDTLISTTVNNLQSLIGKSAFISESAFEQLDEDEGMLTDISGNMEGLYLKVEDGIQVHSRYKLIRPDFIQKIVESGSHWKARQFKTNQVISKELKYE